MSFGDFAIQQDFDWLVGVPKDKVFDNYRGLWELGRNPKNITAYAFWERLIAQYTQGKYELVCNSPAHKYLDGTLGDVFAFDSRK